MTPPADSPRTAAGRALYSDLARSMATAAFFDREELAEAARDAILAIEAEAAAWKPTRIGSDIYRSPVVHPEDYGVEAEAAPADGLRELAAAVRRAGFEDISWRLEEAIDERESRSNG